MRARGSASWRRAFRAEEAVNVPGGYALGALEVEVLLPGDGAPILRDAGARLRELAASFAD